MNIKQKQALSIFLVGIIFMFSMIFLNACSDSNTKILAYFLNLTSAQSTQYCIKVVFDEEENMQEKSVDVQIMSSIDNENLTINHENQTPISITLSKAGRWYSLTEFFAGNDEVEYQKFDDAVDLQYIIKAEQDAQLSFRVIAGEAVSSADTGYILARSEEISNVFTITVKAFSQN